MISKFEGVQEVVSALKTSKKVSLLSPDGGSSSTGISGYSNTCYRGYHGYFGIEDAVITQMADWIKSAN